MKTTFLSLLLTVCLLFHVPVWAQEIADCDEIPNEDPKILKPWIGNNRFLPGILEQHGIYLPEDYYESLDEADFELENVYIIDGHTGEIKYLHDCYRSNDILDVRSLRAGLYLIRYTKDGQIQHFKFLKR